jgi:hypothetical protein
MDLSAHNRSTGETPVLQLGDSEKASDGSFWGRWLDGVAKAQADQPHWMPPIVTSSGELIQQFRYDMSWQTPTKGTGTLANYGYARGLEVIPFEPFEVQIAAPPYQVKEGTKAADGFADWPFLTLKYRALS